VGMGLTSDGDEGGEDSLPPARAAAAAAAEEDGGDTDRFPSDALGSPLGLQLLLRSSPPSVDKLRPLLATSVADLATDGEMRSRKLRSVGAKEKLSPPLPATTAAAAAAAAAAIRL